MFDVVVAGLSNVVVNTLSLQLVNVEIIFNLTFPIELTANYTDFSVIVGDFLPFYGEGTLK